MTAPSLCLLAPEVIELVPALAQPAQAGAVFLAQGLQLQAQLRALILLCCKLECPFLHLILQVFFSPLLLLGVL